MCGEKHSLWADWLSWERTFDFLRMGGGGGRRTSACGALLGVRGAQKKEHTGKTHKWDGGEHKK